MIQSHPDAPDMVQDVAVQDMAVQDMSRGLRERVQKKREEIETYARTTEKRTARYNTISIVFSASAAALATSGVSLGVAWKFLCILAAICSAISVMCLNLVRSSESSKSIEKAHRVGVMLETLGLQLDFKRISLAQGLELYSQALADMPGPDIPKLSLAELAASSGAPLDKSVAKA